MEKVWRWKAKITATLALRKALRMVRMAVRMAREAAGKMGSDWGWG